MDRGRINWQVAGAVTGIPLLAACWIWTVAGPPADGRAGGVRNREPIHVAVLGHAFAWQFSFAGPDGEFFTEDDIAIGSVLHIPQGTPIQFHVTSDDYVYRLSIPQLLLRQAAVPELTFDAGGIARTSGRYDILPDPLCGVGWWHEGPMGRLVVDSRGDFEKWRRALVTRSQGSAS